MDWFLYDNGLRHERVKGYVRYIYAFLFFKTKRVLLEQGQMCFILFQNHSDIIHA